MTKKEYFEGNLLNSNGNMEMKFNTLNDFETFMHEDQAYLIKAEVKPNSEAWESIEAGYLPEEGQEGLIDLNHITVSISFLTEVYEIGMGKGAIDKPTTENEVAEQLREMKAENEALKRKLKDYSFSADEYSMAIDLLDRRSFEEWQEAVEQ